jgi:transketolase
MGRAPPDIERLRKSAKQMRRWIIEQSEASHVGHIGSALSITEIMVVLWEAIMDRPGTADLDRDRFILCKGHASLALYSALRMRGLLSADEYATYCGDGSLLGVHP